MYEAGLGAFSLLGTVWLVDAQGRIQQVHVEHLATNRIPVGQFQQFHLVTDTEGPERQDE